MKQYSYEVIISYKLEQLTELVNNFLHKGWICTGGIFIIQGSMSRAIQYGQAIVKQDV